MSARPIAILKNRLYIPKEYVTQSDLDEFTYTVKAFDSQDPVTLRTYKSFGSTFGFARGDMGKIQRVFGDRFDIQDERSIVPFDYPLQFKATLRPEQASVWKDWLTNGYGLVKAPPRWGKTIFMLHMMTKLRQRTMVLAHESGLLQQFEDTVRNFTNINDLEKEHGIPLCGQLTKYDDCFPIVTFSTWQMLNQPGAVEAIKKNENAFGLMLIDEAHACAAPCFSSIVSSFNPYYRVPVTATEKRKDGFDVVVSDVAGPKVVEGFTEQLSVDVSIIWTKHEIKYFADWNGLWSQLVTDEKRNRLIAKYVAEDVAEGRSCLVITDRRAHAKALQDAILEEDPSITIDVLIGGSAKTSIRDRARSGETQVTIASSKIVQLGWDVPRWSSLHNTLPMANEHNWYQRISRVRTPCAGCPGVDDPSCLNNTKCIKKQPIARIYADPGNPVTFSCLNIMDRVHSKLGFPVKNIKPTAQSAAPGAKRLKTWSETG